jgi:hypothetical protein
MDSIQEATNRAGRTAASISESIERNDAQEPVNSTTRTLLLSAAGVSILGSLALNVMGRKHESLLVGEWVPTLLIIALWYQEVKDARGSRRPINPAPGANPSTSPYGGHLALISTAIVDFVLSPHFP